MATLYISNPTLQHHDLQINLTKPVKPGEQIPHQVVRVLRVPARGQAVFPDDLEGELADRVIQQLTKAGGVPESEPRSIKARFSLLYKFGDKPITSKRIDDAAEVDEAVRQDLAGTELEKAGVAAFNKAANVGGKEVEMTITQTTDQAPVKGGVDVDIKVGTKDGIHGRVSTRKN